jgi:carbon-monoxide dehydrogenase medium subunit
MSRGGTALAGGQSLVPRLKFRTVRPVQVVDLNGLDELAGVSQTSDGHTVIGAMTRHQHIADNPLLRASAMVLAEAAGCIADRQVRARGTIGGNVCNAGPTANMPVALIAASAVAELVGPDGTRRLPVEDLLDSLATGRSTGELVTQFHLETPIQGSSYVEMSPQRHGVPIVNVAVVVANDPNATRVVVSGLLTTPWRATAVEEALSRGDLNERLIATAITEAVHAGEPFTSLRGDARYRAHVASTLVARAAASATDRTDGTN